MDQMFDDSTLFKEGFVPRRHVKALVLKNNGTPSVGYLLVITMQVQLPNNKWFFASLAR